ncbi:NAD(P)H-dependent oxidoreductase subunit E [candidate division KSB1 bacterium]
MKRENIVSIVKKHQGKLGDVISILEDIQFQYRYLPEDALRVVSEETERSLVDIYGVATFYKSFSLKPRGEHLVSVCLGTACHVRGGPDVAKEFEKQLQIKAGDTTKDKKFSLETVNCLGACALGPVVVVDGRYFSKVKTSEVSDILNKARKGIDKVYVTKDQRIFPLYVSCPRCNHGLMDQNFMIDDHPSIRITVSFNRKHGWMRLSSLYGSFNVESEFDIAKNTLLHIFCPHCHQELTGVLECPECNDALMVPLLVRDGGVVQVCPIRGCKGHLLDVS